MTSAVNGEAGRVEPDGKTVTENESEDETPSKKRRKCIGSAQITLLTRWVPDKRAEMEEVDINSEMYELARNWMAETCPKASCGSFQAISQKKPISLFGNSVGGTRRRGAQYWCDCFVVNAILLQMYGRSLSDGRTEMYAT